jgi:hypothetical protein
MGKKHREVRKALKAETRTLEAQGWWENEFGELKKRTTKAEARRGLLRWWQRDREAITKASLEAGERLMEELRPQMQVDIMNRMSEVATKTIKQELDRELFGP